MLAMSTVGVAFYLIFSSPGLCHKMRIISYSTEFVHNMEKQFFLLRVSAVILNFQLVTDPV